MGIKKLTVGALSCLLTVCALPLTSSAAGTADGGYTAEQIAASEIKPVLTVTQLVLDYEEAKADPVQTVQIRISGASMNYSSFGLRFNYDKRLELSETEKMDQVYKGEAVHYMNCGFYYDDTRAAKSDTDNQGWKGLFFYAANVKNYGLDGVMFEFDVILPDDLKPGDVFPFDFVYDVGDLFVSTANDEASHLMQAYLFTRGIYNGDTLFPESDPYIGGTPYDGYIAISGGDSSILYGDANCDASVNVADAVAVLQYVANQIKYPLSDQGFTAADVDGVPGITGMDAATIQKVDAKLVNQSELPLAP